MNRPGKIIIIEGIWGAGKTTLIKNMIKKLSVLSYIAEPNHLRAGILPKSANSITKWYLKAHECNLKRADIIARTGKIVLIERSPLSSIVFSKVYLNKKKDVGMRRFKRHIKNLHDKRGINTYLVYLRPRKMKTTLAMMRGKPYLKAHGKIKLLRSLDYQLRLAIQKIEKENLILVYRNPTFKFLIKLFR